MNSKCVFSRILLSLIILIRWQLTFSTWNFSAINLPDDVPIWKFAIWRNRAFLAVPSFSRKKYNCDIDSEITLLEAAWPEPRNNYTFGITSSSVINAFPKTNGQTKNMSNECDRLLSITGLDVDTRGRLWLLDSPADKNCPAKIIIYDLRRKDRELARSDLQDIAKDKLRNIVVDPVIGISGPRAYIGDPGDETIIEYSLFKRRWRKLSLQRGPDVPRIYSTEIAVSRRNSFLYLTGTRSPDLFSIDLRQLRSNEAPPFVMKNKSFNEANIIALDTMQRFTVNWLGNKMGSSSGLVCDQKGGLHYFLVTEHASVRWDAKRDLKASSHSILLQNEEVPCITDYRIDAQRNVWGLINLEHPFAKIPSSKFAKHWEAKYRTVRVYKYNPFTP